MTNDIKTAKTASAQQPVLEISASVSREEYPWRFKPGQIGNPGGRPKGSVSLKTTMKNALTKERADKLVNKLFQMADSGNIKAVELICQLIDEGRNSANIQINNNTGGSLLTDAEMMNRARQYALNNNIVKAQIIDIDAVDVPVSGSI